jgi:uncharacterized protein
MSPSSPAVEHNVDARRFEVAGETSAYLKYFEGDGGIRLVHTEVPAPLEGRGYGSALVRAALDYARGAHLRVDPVCPFAREYVTRHPEYADLVNPIAPGASSA